MGKVIDLTGQKYGRLTVIKKDNTTNKKGTYWICKCDCGTVKSISRSSLRSGATQSCGCLNREINSRPKEITDMVGKKFGKLTVIKRGDSHITPSGQKKVVWICKCECGNETSVCSEDLKTGHTKSCGCLPTSVKGKGLIDLTGQRFGKLTVIKRADDYTYGDMAVPAWLCKCDCGNMKVMQGGNLRNGIVKHCGCEKQASTGENKVAQILINNNIKHMREYGFDDLVGKGGRKLRFDFAILDNNQKVLMLIEYQSAIHYNEKCSIGAYQRDYTDKVKRQYCKTNHIPLFEIKYDNEDEDIHSVLNEIKTKIYANPVPSVDKNIYKG